MEETQGFQREKIKLQLAEWKTRRAGGNRCSCARKRPEGHEEGFCPSVSCREAELLPCTTATKRQSQAERGCPRLISICQPLKANQTVEIWGLCCLEVTFLSSLEEEALILVNTQCMGSCWDVIHWCLQAQSLMNHLYNNPGQSKLALNKLLKDWKHHEHISSVCSHEVLLYQDPVWQRLFGSLPQTHMASWAC